MIAGIAYTVAGIIGCAIYAAFCGAIWYLLWCCYLNCPTKRLREIPRESISMGSRWWGLFFICLCGIIAGTYWLFFT